MKVPLCIWVTAALAASSVHGAVLMVSDFSSLSAQYLPPMGISWSNAGTDQYIQNSGFATIGPVGGGNPQGDGYFIATFPNTTATVDFTGMSSVTLTASANAGNASSVVKVTFLDNALTPVASANFQASSLTTSFSSQSLSLSFSGVGNAGMVSYWRLEGDGISSDGFRYSFDNLSVSTVPVPEPCIAALCLLGAGGFGLFSRRERLTKSFVGAARAVTASIYHDHGMNDHD